MGEAMAGNDGDNNIRKPPEDTKDRSKSTLDEVEIIHLPNGEEIVVSAKGLEKDKKTNQHRFSKSYNRHSNIRFAGPSFTGN